MRPRHPFDPTAPGAPGLLGPLRHGRKIPVVLGICFFSDHTQLNSQLPFSTQLTPPNRSRTDPEFTLNAPAASPFAWSLEPSNLPASTSHPIQQIQGGLFFFRDTEFLARPNTELLSISKVTTKGVTLNREITYLNFTSGAGIRSPYCRWGLPTDSIHWMIRKPSISLGGVSI